MPLNECEPFFETGDVTGQATAAITGKRFLKPSGERTSGPGLSDTVEGSNYRFAHADPGGPTAGVSQYDAGSGAKVAVHGNPGKIVPVTVAADTDAGDEVMVGTAGRGVPYDESGAVPATLDTGVVGNNNAITWTAIESGDGGNDITIALVFSDANVGATTVDVDGKDIVVTLRSNDTGGGTILATADEVKAAIAEHDTASQLVTAVDKGASDGSGVVTAVAETPLAGGAGDTPARAVGLCMNGAVSGSDAEVKLY